MQRTQIHVKCDRIEMSVAT